MRTNDENMKKTENLTTARGETNLSSKEIQREKEQLMWELPLYSKVVSLTLGGHLSSHFLAIHSQVQSVSFQDISIYPEH